MRYYEILKEDVNMTKDQIINKMLSILETVEEKYKNQSSTNTSSSPAAPNTSIFRATQSGFIRMVPGTYESVWSYSEKKYIKQIKSYGALQVGTLIDPSIRKEMFQDIGELLKQEFGNEVDTIQDGYLILVDEGKEYPTRVVLDYQFGTNYCSFVIK